MVKKDIKPLVELSLDDKKRLLDLDKDIERGDKAIAALKELGINVTEIEGKLTWAKKAREVLLKDFT